MEQLKEQIGNLALLVVMTPDNDRTGVELLVSICEDIEKAASVCGGQERILAALKQIFAKRNDPSVYALIQDFVTTAEQLLEGAGSAKFAGEKADSPDALVHPDLADSLDPAFLVEFIETHQPKLDEFEAALVDEDTRSLLDTAVKRYLHNLKGDAGSIGLIGFEKACHRLEDMLLSTEASALIPELIAFKEWAVECLNALANGSPPSRSEADLFAGLDSDIEEEDELEVSRQIIAAPDPKPAAVEGSYKLTGEADILLEFAAEAEEHLCNVERVTLEAEGNFTKDAIDTIFRGIHSLKGGSAYFQLEEMTKCSHILENYLSEVRDGKRVIDAELNALILTYIDLQKDILSRAKQASAGDGIMTCSKNSIEFLRALERYGKGLGQAPRASVEADPADERPDAPAQRSSKLDIKDFVKVETTRLDHLIDSIGEMVIYSSMLIRYCRTLLQDNEDVMDMTHRVEKFSRDLQDVGMSMRLVPIKALFQKMSRLVWDTSRKIGKAIHFTMDGEDTELDRNLIDKLADPLMHMVRNALDHGIESPQERELSGKPKHGVVKLSAFHAGGSIHIQITDDGRGLNPEKLLAKAVDKGIVAPGQKLSQEEIFQLIFAPGFSTAAVVTDISGRGVGMDVVRRNVESLRGQIHIQSEVGKGSTFTIELPLTLAIIDGIQIRVGKEYFVIPSLSIVEFVRPTRSMITNTLDVGETMLFRDRYLPIYRLSELYDIDEAHTNFEDSEIVVVENGHELVAIMVDEILGQCSTVIKSLGALFEENRGTAGCAVMPTGDVALIIDIRSLVQLARSSYRTRQRLEAPAAIQ